MRENRLREIWGGGGQTINGWLGIPSSYSAEVMAHQGWDSLVVDLQHGVVDYQTAVTMLQAVSTTDVVPMARVPWFEPGIIMKMLDAGCYGIICPMINSRTEAEAFVGACRYAPDGYRSYGPVRATLYAGADYQPNANATVLALAMIETAKALDNLDEIVSTPGLDGIYIGPADLSLSLGYEAKLDFTAPEVLDAVTRICNAARAAGIVAGIHCQTTGHAKKMLALGFQMVTIWADGALLASAAKQAVDAMRGG